MSGDLEAKSVVDQTGEKENVTENVLPIRTEPLGSGGPLFQRHQKPIRMRSK